MFILVVKYENGNNSKNFKRGCKLVLGVVDLQRSLGLVSGPAICIPNVYDNFSLKYQTIIPI